MPFSFNLAMIPSDNVSSGDAEILIQLRPGHRPSADYIRAMRAAVAGGFPGALFYFQTADIVSQVLNFGLAAPIDLQIRDTDFTRSYALAQRLLQAVQKIPGVADAHIAQILDYPALQVDVDRLRAAAARPRPAGRLQQPAGGAVSSSSLVAPSYFLNPVNSVNYFVAVRMPMDEHAQRLRHDGRRRSASRGRCRPRGDGDRSWHRRPTRR